MGTQHDKNDGRGPLPDDPAAQRKNRKGARNKWPSDKGAKPDDIESLLKWLEKYVADMHLWGQRVRLDILALEEGIGHGPGDPGDPPAGPW